MMQTKIHRAGQEGIKREAARKLKGTTSSTEMGGGLSTGPPQAAPNGAS